MSVSRARSSLSPSPSSLVLDSKLDFANFSLCPELSLGDLALPDIPGFDSGLHESLFILNSTAIPDSLLLLRDSHQVPQSPNCLDQCEAFVNFPAQDKIPTSPSQNAVVSHGYSGSLSQTGKEIEKKMLVNAHAFLTAENPKILLEDMDRSRHLR